MARHLFSTLKLNTGSLYEKQRPIIQIKDTHGSSFFAEKQVNKM